MNESKYSNVQEVAKFFDISESTVRLWVKKGLIDRSCYVKADTTYRFDIPAIEQHLRGGEGIKSDNVSLSDVSNMYSDIDMSDEDYEKLVDTFDNFLRGWEKEYNKNNPKKKIKERGVMRLEKF